MKHLTLIATFIAAVLTAATLIALAAPDVAERPNDEAAIRASVESYVAAYNRGDATAVAAHWSDQGHWISPSGQRIVGRQAIEKEMKALFADSPGAKVEVLDPRVRFVTADVAIEEGSARVIRPGEPPDESTYLAIHVKKDGKWRLDSVRETELPEALESPAHEQLKDLEWMVGEWIDQDPNSTVETDCRWAKSKSFLLRTFRVSAPGVEDLEGTQVVGWDPVRKVIRSWVFDSDGGYLEGTWTRKENAWTVKAAGYLADGRKAASVNVFTYVDPNTFTWRSFGRQVDGQFMPDVPEVKVVRKQAAK
jgi:uncharacterized protein (TIGR02246 family)